MKYFMNTADDHIVSVVAVRADGDGNITESEYNQILTMLHNRPQETKTTGYYLTTSLEWVEYAKESEPDVDDIDDNEALNIILGETE